MRVPVPVHVPVPTADNMSQLSFSAFAMTTEAWLKGTHIFQHQEATSVRHTPNHWRIFCVHQKAELNTSVQPMQAVIYCGLDASQNRERRFKLIESKNDNKQAQLT